MSGAVTTVRIYLAIPFLWIGKCLMPKNLTPSARAAFQRGFVRGLAKRDKARGVDA